MGAKREPPLCVKTWSTKIAKKTVCRKVSFEKKCFQKARCIEKKFREKHFSYPRPLQENNGPSLMASVC